MTVEELDRAIAIEEAIIKELQRIGARASDTLCNAENRLNVLMRVKASLGDSPAAVDRV